NVTPDSFSDGGRSSEQAIQHALQLIADGADILDVGGESTRPDSAPVPKDEELRRVLPVVSSLSMQTRLPISIDTMKGIVARSCIEVGAEIVNDVSGLRDREMIDVVRITNAAAVVMHMQGTPQTMQLDPKYENVVTEVGAFFEERLRTLKASGIA